MFVTITQAVSALQAGMVIAYPTEAVYGLGCDPMNEQAVATIWKLKQRPEAMGLIIVASNWQQLIPYMHQLDERHHVKLVSSWPDALTWVVPAAENTPHWLTGGRDTIALRWTSHPDVCALCDAFGGAIVSTSANLHGQPPCVDADCVRFAFADQAVFAGVLEGRLGNNAKPTPIRDLMTGAWLRS